MATRHLARSIVMQTLFERDFTSENSFNGEEALEYNIEEFGPGIEDKDFIRELFQGVAKKQKVIDDVIVKAAPEWPLEKIAAVDRNVLRVGLYELLFGDRENVPPKVAINEAIELAKSFGGENSGRFVNGVLGAVYKEMGEPGKDDMGGKKQQEEPINYEDLPVEEKAGAVVYAKDENDGVHFAMVHDVFGYWTLSKDGIEGEESAEDAVKRAVKEEMGLEVEVKEQIGENEYVANHPEKGKLRKKVYYYLAHAPYDPVTLTSDSGGLDNAQWFPLEEIVDLTMYEDVTNLLTDSINKLTSNK